jgi:hypothetical protein
MASGVTRGQAIQPGPRARAEAQAARRTGHGPRGATQDTQPLLVNVMEVRSRRTLAAAICRVDAMNTGTWKVMRNRYHAEIVKAGGDVVVSIRWQLYDIASAVAAKTQVDGERDAA